MRLNEQEPADVVLARLKKSPPKPGFMAKEGQPGAGVDHDPTYPQRMEAWRQAVAREELRAEEERDNRKNKAKADRAAQKKRGITAEREEAAMRGMDDLALSEDEGAWVEGGMPGEEEPTREKGKKKGPIPLAPRPKPRHHLGRRHRGPDR